MLSRLFLGSALVGLSSLAYADVKTINHEINIGFSDLREVNDRFIGLRYRHYFDSVELSEQPWLISPYLQRNNNIYVSYLGVSDVLNLEVGTEWFVNKNWVLRARLWHLNDESELISLNEKRLGADLGYFIHPNWEIGGGVDYFSGAEDFIFGSRREDEDVSFNVFTRYTSFEPGSITFKPGWDISFKAISIGDRNSLELTTRYFFKPKWSASLDVLNIQNSRGSSNTVVELGTDYWFNPYASIRLGAGYDIDDQGLGSLTLLANFRF